MFWIREQCLKSRDKSRGPAGTIPKYRHFLKPGSELYRDIAFRVLRPTRRKPAKIVERLPVAQDRPQNKRPLPTNGKAYAFLHVNGLSNMVNARDKCPVAVSGPAGRLKQPSRYPYSRALANGHVCPSCEICRLAYAPE
jgi:hypothetical protein